MVLIPSLLIPCGHLSGILTSFAAKYSMGFLFLRGALCASMRNVHGSVNLCITKCVIFISNLYVQVSMIVILYLRSTIFTSGPGCSKAG